MTKSRPRPIKPGPGQESVWDYPRPPRVEAATRPVRVEYKGVVIAQSNRALRVLELSQPPAYYIPPADVQMQHLTPTSTRTLCEWKGLAHYWTITVDDHTAIDAAWSYPSPTPRYTSIAGYLAFYPQRVTACYVGEEQVRANEGDFYGGWITSDVVGPFKGGAGTGHW